MIYGVGHDVLEIKRLSILISGPQGEKFMNRVLTEQELAISRTKGAKLNEFVAGRFAAKEAITKAFGCGIGRTINFTDMEILPDALGKPVVQLSQAAWDRLDLEGGAAAYHVHLSISHQTEIASAFAVVERIQA
ncbi:MULTISPECIES: holo-ACP synthase [Paenibacillus]|uniref:holo-ACP synthase n=1 Tax=Paenibacillus TaxID=44249 RepID=UPI000373A50A|nr:MULTISPECIES: holo-ACP synthase [Paenibacillus]